MKKFDLAINASFGERELVGLHALSQEVPNIDAAVAQQDFCERTNRNPNQLLFLAMSETP